MCFSTTLGRMNKLKNLMKRANLSYRFIAIKKPTRKLSVQFEVIQAQYLR